MSFDTLAPYYRWMESILAGGKMHRCRMAFLDQIPRPKNILLLGEGHGPGLVECCRRFAEAQIICVDASERMLAQARRQLARHRLNASRVAFTQADILNWLPSSKTYDLIVTNFFLDCFRPEQLEQLIPRIVDCSAPDATWLIADFQIPSFRMATYSQPADYLDAVCLLPHDDQVGSTRTDQTRYTFGESRLHVAPPHRK